MNDMDSIRGRQSITNISRTLIKRCENKWDAVVCVTGGEGVGKSTLAIELTKEICKQRKIPWDMAKYILISPNQQNISDTMINYPHISPITLDEATNSLHKGDWYTKEQKYLNKLFTLARMEFKIVFILIPRIQDLNKYFREGRIKLWMHVLERGTASIFIKDDNPFAEDPWHFKQARKMLDKYHGSWMGDISEKVNLLEKLKIYRGFIQFDALTNDEESVYLQLKKEKKYKNLVEEEKIDRWKEYTLRLYWYLRQLRKEGGVVSYEEMSNIINLDQASMNGWASRYSYFFERLEGDKSTKHKARTNDTNNIVLEEEEKSGVV